MILFTDAEYGEIKKKAAAVRVSIGAICRQWCFRGLGVIQTDIFKS